MVNLILEGILLITPESAPPIICEILDGCWKSLPADRLNFQQIDDKLMEDQQARRSHRIIQENVMCNYINPYPVAESTTSLIRMDEQPTAIVTFTEAHQAIASINTVTKSIDPYLELICPDLHEDNTPSINSNPAIIITCDD